MRDVAHDAHLQPFKRAEALAHGESVEQGLGGMLVLAVAAVDHAGADMALDDARGALLAAAHDDEVGIHSIERGRRVGKRLAFFCG